MKGLLGALTGVGPILDAGKTGGRSLLDPICSSNPQLQKYTDVAGLIHPRLAIDPAEFGHVGAPQAGAVAVD